MEIREKEIRTAIETAWKIPGLYRKGEAEFLYRLARRRGNLVEIGCWMGRTTSLMLQAAQVWGASLTTIDPFAPMPHGHAQATAARWRKNLAGVGLQPPALLEMESDQAAGVYQNEIALLFIDGDHSREAVRSDLHHWTPKIKPGGVVALHDMFYPSVTGVCDAVVDWWLCERDDTGPRWVLAGQIDFTIAFRRLK